MSSRRVALADLAAPVRNAIVGGPFGSYLVSSDYVAAGVPVIRGQNMAGRWVTGPFAFVTAEKAASLSQNLARPGDLVFTQRGTLGQVALVPDRPFADYVVSQSQMKITVDQSKADAKFLYYLFRTPEQRQYIFNSAIQTGVPHTNLGIFKATPIDLPTLAVQKGIAAICSALDDRIDLLREANATLEAITQALFKSWFVDFDPVRAKSQGLSPAGMDQATAALFPASFMTTPSGSLPAGWCLVSLREVTAIFDSRRVPLAGQERAHRKGSYPYYGAAALMDHVDDYLFEGVHLLLGEDGSVVDQSGMPITQYVWGKFWVNNHAHVLQGKGAVTTEHLMLALKQTNIQPFVTGAVQAKLSQSNMWRIQFLMPSLEVAARFGEMIAPLYGRLRHNSEQAQTLATLRDTLLPRLISGQIRLPEATTQAEEALA